MYKEISEEEFLKSNESYLLIVTATDLETEILHGQLKTISGKEKLLLTHNGERTYYKGVFGEYTCIHVQCDTMGSIGSSSSIITISEAIRYVKPKVTIMIGIAFGIDETEQKIGDVLVASSIIPYDFKKITPNKTSVRAQAVPSSTLLINKFKNARSWEFYINSCKASKYIAPVFSGEELINSVERRNELTAFNDQAKGGEMEGVGLSSAANGKTEWILVKGICDFADGHKDLNKDENQKIAMASAISLCLEVFSSTEAFKSIELYPCNLSEIQSNTSSEFDSKLVCINNPSEINKILFDTYDMEKEEYYVERTIDELIMNCLKFQSIWVHGKSGRGKSISVLRNIIQNSHKNICVSLANCSGFGVDSFFNEIYVELSLYLEPDAIPKSYDDHREAVRAIKLLLEKHFLGKEIFILIDEIPLGNDESFHLFSERIFSLFMSSSVLSQKVDIKYVLSSIYSPESNIKEYQQSVRSKIRFVEFKDWSQDEICKLLDLIENSLQITLDKSVKETLITSSKGSPRWLKKFFRNFFILGDQHINRIESAIEQTNSEITV